MHEVTQKRQRDADVSTLRMTPHDSARPYNPTDGMASVGAALRSALRRARPQTRATSALASRAFATSAQQAGAQAAVQAGATTQVLAGEAVPFVDPLPDRPPEGTFRRDLCCARAAYRLPGGFQKDTLFSCTSPVSCRQHRRVYFLLQFARRIHEGVRGCKAAGGACAAVDEAPQHVSGATLHDTTSSCDHTASPLNGMTPCSLAAGRCWSSRWRCGARPTRR